MTRDDFIDELRFEINDDIGLKCCENRDDYCLMIDGCLPSGVEKLYNKYVPSVFSEEEFDEIYNESLDLEFDEVFGDDDDEE